ncbi:MAG: hypothetical protein BM560_15095 [Roseobacter sp. MedPE-SWde]|nr:MAG: hypothetical protein BM560_15095 [Roseobacter sp. MedPE-SWde]
MVSIALGLYALLATGLAVVWTTLQVLNFAHGTFVALGAYIAWQVAQTTAGALGYLFATAISMIAMFGIGLPCISS